MKKIILATSILLSVEAFAEPCIAVFSQALSPIEKMVFNSKDIKIQYKAPTFSSNYEIKVMFQGKELLSFANKMMTANSIATDYSRDEHSSLRHAYDKSYQKLTYKLWLLEKSQTPIRIDLSKLRSVGTFGGRCYVDVSSIEGMIVEKPVEKTPEPAVEVGKKEEKAPKEVPPPLLTPPDRSAMNDMQRSSDGDLDPQPTRQ